MAWTGLLLERAGERESGRGTNHGHGKVLLPLAPSPRRPLTSSPPHLVAPSPPRFRRWHRRDHPPGVFQVALERVQKGGGGRSVDDPMVESQAEEEHRPLGDLALIHR